MSTNDEINRLKTVAETLSLLIASIDRYGATELSLALKHARQCALKAIAGHSAT